MCLHVVMKQHRLHHLSSYPQYIPIYSFDFKLWTFNKIYNGWLYPQGFSIVFKVKKDLHNNGTQIFSDVFYDSKKNKS